MSKLGRKAKQQKKTEEKEGRNAMLYLVIALVVIAIFIGIFVI